MKTDTFWRHATLWPALVLFALLTILPLIKLLALSFHDVEWINREAVWDWVGLANYARLPQDNLLRAGALNTLIFAVVAVALQMLIGFILALLTTRVVRGRVFYRTVFILPTLVPGIIIGAIWKLMYNTQFGIINQALDLVALGPFDWLGSSSLALASVIAVDVWHWTPFSFLLLLAAVEALPRDVFEASQIDGAGAWRTFRRITLPLLMPAIFTTFVFRAIIAFKVFDEVYLSTCGFDHIRQPETEDAGGLPLHQTPQIDYPLHGLGAHQPATLIGHGVSETGDRPHLWCEGEVIQSMTFRHALRLRRRIEMPLGGSDLRIRDRVDNIGPHPAPSMMLYHFNLGYPLVDADSRLEFDAAEALWQSADHDPRAPCGPPDDAHVSEISVHRPAAPGSATCRLVNPTRRLALDISFDTATLPCLQLLRLRGAGYYMAGIEPCTTVHRNRRDARAAGELPMLAPGEARDFALDISLVRSPAAHVKEQA